jgi:ketosteroid isomerase-like protein
MDPSFHAAERALRQAQLAGDVSTLDALLDEDLVFTGPDGAIYRKQDDLEAHRRGAIRITQLAPSDEYVQDFGSIVVVSVRMEMRGSFNGAPFAGPFRYTRIWRAQDHHWRVVAGHVSAIATASVGVQAGPIAPAT